MSDLNDYEIRDEIGSGAYGAVYRAWQPAVGRGVAIKVTVTDRNGQPVPGKRLLKWSPAEQAPSYRRVPRRQGAGHPCGSTN